MSTDSPQRRAHDPPAPHHPTCSVRAGTAQWQRGSSPFHVGSSAGGAMCVSWQRFWPCAFVCVEPAGSGRLASCSLKAFLRRLFQRLRPAGGFAQLHLCLWKWLSFIFLCAEVSTSQADGSVPGTCPCPHLVPWLAELWAEVCFVLTFTPLPFVFEALLHWLSLALGCVPVLCPGVLPLHWHHWEVIGLHGTNSGS